MSYKLNEEARIRYNDTERKVFSIIAMDGEVNTTELVNKFYRRKTKPYHSREIMIGTIRSLMRKMQENEERWQIVKSKRTGPIPIKYTLRKPV